jgi:hypothetical protein
VSLLRIQAGSRPHRALRAAAVAAVVLVAVGLPFDSSPVINGELTPVLVYAVAVLGLNLLVGYSPRSAANQGSGLRLGLKPQVGGLRPGGNPDSA